MSFKLHCRAVGNTLIACITGNLIAGNSVSLSKKLSKRISQDDVNVILDMTGIEYIDSMGMGDLTVISSIIKKHFGHLTIISPRREVTELISRSVYGKHIEIKEAESA
ncbi:STAS domain-containing protein [Spartinivicinus poritis]|uniref:STAS domain-containing protein n=1 Tax=Spartinivicinus poritis TaxID=2994640 RepID=A0ABT5UGS5_9GAMM|nr:STAS domain-containing protein [Spartinivicinus sp. A2-2]MDE1465596.1 STAS domain-containing protein [Spartinivicinus sp. A2-2]